MSYDTKEEKKSFHLNHDLRQNILVLVCYEPKNPKVSYAVHLWKNQYTE